MTRVEDPFERVTAFTDVLLGVAALGAVFYLRAQASPVSFKPAVWMGSFGCIAASAAAGAAYHGLVLPERTRRGLWQFLGLALVTAVSLFAVGVVFDGLGERPARLALVVMPAAGLAVFAVSRLYPGLFLVFILYEGAALGAALAAYGWLAAKDALAGAGLMAAGIAVSLLAAGIQAVKTLKFKVVWAFDHNALFHLLQIAGLVLLCAGLARS